MDIIKDKMEKILEEMGFVKTYIGDSKFYKNNFTGCYHSIIYVSGLKSYIIESAENYEEAKKGRFEDSDIYHISMGEDEILAKFRGDLVKYYLD